MLLFVACVVHLEKKRKTCLLFTVRMYETSRAHAMWVESGGIFSFSMGKLLFTENVLFLFDCLTLQCSRFLLMINCKRLYEKWLHSRNFSL